MVFVYTAPKSLIAERVPPRYDFDVALTYSVRRLLSAGTELKLVTTSDVGGIYTEDDDLLPGAAERVLESGFDTAPLKDHDDATYTTPASDVPGGAERDHAEWDLGSLAYRVVVLVFESTSELYRGRVYVSADRLFWYKVIDCGGGVCASAYGGSFRYVKLSSYNAGGYTAIRENFRHRSLEVYPAVGRKSLVAGEGTVKTIRVATRYFSQLLELARLA